MGVEQGAALREWTTLTAVPDSCAVSSWSPVRPAVWRTKQGTARQPCSAVLEKLGLTLPAPPNSRGQPQRNVHFAGGNGWTWADVRSCAVLLLMDLLAACCGACVRWAIVQVSRAPAGSGLCPSACRKTKSRFEVGTCVQSTHVYPSRNKGSESEHMQSIFSPCQHGHTLPFSF